MQLVNDAPVAHRSEEHTSELQSPCNLVCRLLLEKKKTTNTLAYPHDPRQTRPAWRWRRVPQRLAGGRCPTHRRPPCCFWSSLFFLFFFFNDTATTEIYTLSLHDALPICRTRSSLPRGCRRAGRACSAP